MHQVTQVGAIESYIAQWFPEAFVRAARIAEFPVMPQELALVERAVATRKKEFTTGRWLSRQGLRHFGLPDTPIGIGKLRNPLWPVSVLGSITHDADLCAVILEKKMDCAAGVGIDLVSLASRVENMAELLPIFLTDSSELESIKSCDLDVDPALLLFSLKESVIKALSFMLNNFIDMREVQIYRQDMQLKFKFQKQEIPGEIFFAKPGAFLLTAAKAFTPA